MAIPVHSTARCPDRRRGMITGLSPLQAWLKSSMVPEILNVVVSQEFLDCSSVINAPCKKTSASKCMKMEMTTDESVPVKEAVGTWSSFAMERSSS